MAAVEFVFIPVPVIVVGAAAVRAFFAERRKRDGRATVKPGLTSIERPASLRLRPASCPLDADTSGGMLAGELAAMMRAALDSHERSVAYLDRAVGAANDRALMLITQRRLASGARDPGPGAVVHDARHGARREPATGGSQGLAAAGFTQLTLAFGDQAPAPLGGPLERHERAPRAATTATIEKGHR